MGNTLSEIIRAIPNLPYILARNSPTTPALEWLQRRLSHYLSYLPYLPLRLPFRRDTRSLPSIPYWTATTALLDASNAHASIPPNVPVVRYYAPKLLPLYRTPRHHDPEASEYVLPPRTFCKWRRMVYPDERPLTISEAREQIKQYSSRDRREIWCIARLVCDEAVFDGTMPRTSRYANMWAQWLARKGPDVAIVFEREQ